MPAKKLTEVYEYFRYAPIADADFNALYEPADVGRGKPVYAHMQRRLISNPEGSLQFLFAGHRGCGKSTELARLQREIEADFLVVKYSVTDLLDPNNIDYVELFIVAMERLFATAAQDNRLSLDQELLDAIGGWVASREITEINQNYLGMDIQTQIKSGIDVPFLAKFFAKFTAAAKTSSSMNEVIRKKVEPRLSDLIDNCNLLIERIKNQLPAIGKKGLVVIIEDLDKINISRAEDIFYSHSAQITQLRCHSIFTFPIPLLYNIRYRTIANFYSGRDHVLPMIKVCERTGGECKDGRQVLRNIVGRRMDHVLIDQDGLTRLIVYSGGCLQDLFRMIQDAADSALDNGRAQISHSDCLAACKALKIEYELTIAENRARGFTVADYFTALGKCALDPTKKPHNSEIMLDLRHNLTVLSYNGENWNDVHPAVRDILKEKGLIT